MKKGSTPLPPKGVKKPLPPSPPPGPPNRTYKEVFWIGLIETKESKQRRHDYEVYMRGYRDGANSRKI